MEEKKVSKKRKFAGGEIEVRKRGKFTLKAKATASFSRVELKCVDLTSTSAFLNITTSGGWGLLNGTVPGNAIQNRLGRKIRMKSVRIMGSVLQYQQGSIPIDDLLQLYLVYDRQPNGGQFNVSDFLQCTDNAGTTNSSNFSFINMSNAERFKVLRHSALKMENIGASINQPAQESCDFAKRTMIDWFVPLDLPTQYNTGTAGTISDIQTGALYMFVLGGANGANAEYTLQYNVRLRFRDL